MESTSSTIADSRCALCSTVGRLRQSHVIPKFVFDWTKRRGEGLRASNNPNLQLQDGPKPRMLCGACESRFSGWEREAASKVFRPIHSSNCSELSYGPWFLKFAVSVSFRVLQYYGDWVRTDPKRAQSVRERCEFVTKEWAKFLLGRRSLLGPYEHYCVVLPSSDTDEPSERTLASFFEGVIDFQPALTTPDDGIAVITKMCRLCIVGTVQRGRSKDWVNARIASKGGLFCPPFAMPTWFVDYLGSRLREAQHVQQLSPRQRALLLERALKRGW